jgi:hypothetical protein
MAGSGQDVRIGDAERTAMSETLGKHYSEGRLDESEFRERIDRAMAAKTRGDLSGLLVDLPPLTPEGSPSPPVRRRNAGAVAVLLLLAVVVGSFGSLVFHPHIPWLLIAIVAFLLFRGRRWRRRHFVRM